MPTTRLYLPSSGAPPVSPAFDAWDSTSFATRVFAPTSKSSTAPVDVSHSFITDDTNSFVCFRQYVSSPIAAVDFTGKTFSAVIQGKVSNSSNLAMTLAGSVRLYHADTTFSTLYALAITGAPFSSATAKTRIFNAVSTLGETSISGDRIVFEIGAFIGVAATATGQWRFLDNNASDFALTADLTTDLNPWAEFNVDLATTSTSSANFLSMF